MYSNKNIEEYYDTTQVHYEIWWKLKETQAIHYGIWDDSVNSFSESLLNTNRLMMETAQIKDGEKVLDAGCGIGGSAFYLSQQREVKVVGISLSKKQILTARNLAEKNDVANKLSFDVMDYTQTTFPDESFDVVWACESICHAPDKQAFINESYRILKKGGRLILCDYFLTDENQADPKNRIKKWLETWSISHIPTSEKFNNALVGTGFKETNCFDYSKGIQNSAKRMYYSSLLAFFPSEIYNFFHRNVSRFAKTHYKSGYYQYKALRENLWKYMMIVAKK